MAVGVEDGRVWVAHGQVPAASLTVSVVPGTTVGVEVGSLMDERSALGIGTVGGGSPEGTAEVDGSESIGI